MKSLIFMFAWVIWSPAMAKPLFFSGTESFKIVDGKHKTPVFRIFEDTVTKKSLALAVNSALNAADSESDEVKPFVEVRLEKLFLEPVKGTDRLKISLQISGRDYKLAPTVSKAELLKGKAIAVKVPPQEKEIALFTVTSKGQMTLKYVSGQNVLLIEKASAQMNFESPMTDEESELIKFSGKGLREISVQ